MILYLFILKFLACVHFVCWRFEIQILKSLVGIYTWIWINGMFVFQTICIWPNWTNLSHGFNHYDPIHITINGMGSCLGLISGAFLDLFFIPQTRWWLHIFQHSIIIKKANWGAQKESLKLMEGENWKRERDNGNWVWLRLSMYIVYLNFELAHDE